MTETPRDPFAPDPTPQPEPVTPPEPVEPVTPPEPLEPAPPAEPAEPVEPIAPPEPLQPIAPPEPLEPIAPPEIPPPPAPVEVPAPEPTAIAAPPLGSGSPEAPPSYENAGDAQVDPASLLPADASADAREDAPPAAVPRRSWLPVTAVAIAVLLLAGATGWLGWQVRQGSVAEAGRPDAVAAARDAARLLFSYSHETLEEDFAKGLAVTAGEFRSEYSRTTKEVVTPVAEQYDAVVVAEVVEASIVDAGPGRATALVFLNQGTTSTRVQGQQVDQSRVRMHLVDRDGRWLVRAVDAL
ncbi:MAG: hypothetical protein EPN99_11080 [Frankiales bacterium]|nr:MAG: hypothetical protein EPN99_11080 [Frankiales bacterium]